MIRLWKGAVTAVDTPKRKAVLQCKDAASAAGDGKEQRIVISWDLVTRVTESGRGLIPAQQVQIGQMVSADCTQDQDGRWLARAIEIVTPVGSGQRSVTQQHGGG